MKNWIKKTLAMTPDKRLLIAFLLGSFQTTAVYRFMEDTRGLEGQIAYLTATWSDTHWSVWLGVWLVVLLLYIRNSMNFSKETLWMTIKNPAKVTVSQEENDTLRRHWPTPPPGYCPPPTKPPPPPSI